VHLSAEVGEEEEEVGEVGEVGKGGLLNCAEELP
jgi:hypothetical protein